MQNKDWITVICVLLCCMLFGNRKVRLFALIKEQLKVFRNDKKKRISPWDYVCFLLFPVVISLVFVFKLDLKYSLQGTTQGRYLTGGVPPVRFSM